MPEEGLPTMDDFVLIAFGIRLLKFGLTALLVVMLSTWLDGRAAKAMASVGIAEHGFGAALAFIRRNAIASAIYYGARILALAILAGMLMGCVAASAGVVMTDRYDRQIRGAVATYWPDYPHWPAWKAQLYQESKLNPRAVSPVGAAGLAQFMPGTWADVARQLRLPPDLRADSDMAIEAGAYYMAQLRRAWSSPRPAEDRHQLAQASYNAGLGNLLAAQRACRGAVLYAGIIACLPAITGRYSEETIAYVDRIARWRAMIEAGL